MKEVFKNENLLFETLHTILENQRLILMNTPGGEAGELADNCTYTMDKIREEYPEIAKEYFARG